MSMLGKAALILFLLLPGLAVVVVCGHFGLQDYHQLRAAYAHFEQVANSNAPVTAVLVAEARQNMHRLNLVAEGVWLLLGALLAGLGLHGLVTTGSARGRGGDGP